MTDRKWYEETGTQNDIAISTRVRLARNLEEYPFPEYLTAAQQKELNEIVKMAAIGGDNPFGFKYIDMEKTGQVQAISMAEQRITSPEFSLGRAGRGVLLTSDNSVSVMLGEEDHIRIQVMKSGFELEEAYRIADEVDDLLGENLRFAFSGELGYLTQCPTNLGTGMRASVLLHLPGLKAKGQINRLAATVSKLGLTIRGAYGEGSEPKGDFYQLSNQVTLGISEENAIQNLKAITVQIINQERTAQRELMENERFEDNIWRAYGILTNTRTIDSEEFMSLISLVMIGVSQGIFSVNSDRINKLIMEVQPATLAIFDENAKYAGERDRLRAKIVRATLKGDTEE